MTVKGWVKSSRGQKVNTFLDLDDGISGPSKLQVVAETDALPEGGASYHAAVIAQGLLEKSDHPGQEFELKADRIQVVNGVDVDSYPFQPRKRYDEEHPRSHPEFRAKLNDFASMLRIRSGLTRAFHDFFHQNGYVQIQTPILTSSDCEGAGEVFMVQPANPKIVDSMRKQDAKQEDSEVYFDQNVFLTVSGQLHLEAICNGIAKVYTFSPAFRAEMGRTRRHLAEFSMIEAEVAFLDKMPDLLAIQESMIKHVFESVLSSNLADIKNYLQLSSLKQKGKTKGVSGDDLGHIERIVKENFVVMSYSEAMDALESTTSKKKKKFQVKPIRGQNLGKEHELYLTEEFCNGVPVFVVDWPENCKAFYSRRSATEAGLVEASDLLFPDVGEICGGTLREADYDVLKSQMEEKSINMDSLGWYLDLRRQGAAPCGGFGLGFERLIQYMLKIHNIRDAVPFSRSPHKCKL